MDGITVRQDSEGRYSHNDVHDASGTSSTYAPGQWARYEAQSLVAELKVGDPTIEPLTAKAGRYGGTYAVKALVYTYAM
ncbi:hypothetical protein DKY63_28420 [Pseudomonas putida]|uniref:KilA/APSES-type HTH DNA-binding domain-containing protein n=1 Tax=Pseudomonas putida TaxID=303 RepID=A0A2Z4RSJ1_PSEPU|nr:hypothetical protein DKY63_28420 [Pseudomonas putida]